MKKSRKPESFIQKTVYPGGLDALRKDIMELMNYPEEAIKANVEGSIVVTMDIDNKGIVSNAKIKRARPWPR
ncbi:MAG: energy transducer TonB [Bacteroidetes bacterium]|nr:energy transducer TonB [Bacteroidota bacterium]